MATDQHALHYYEGASRAEYDSGLINELISPEQVLEINRHQLKLAAAKDIAGLIFRPFPIEVAEQAPDALKVFAGNTSEYGSATEEVIAGDPVTKILNSPAARSKEFNDFRGFGIRARRTVIYQLIQNGGELYADNKSADETDLPDSSDSD